MNCELHQVAMQEKTGEFGTYYSHIIPNVGFCNGKRIKPFTPKNEEVKPQVTKVEEVSAPTEDTKVDWDAKDRQSMAQTAMKSASEIVAALINIGEVTAKETPGTLTREMANEFYKELLSMKSQK